MKHKSSAFYYVAVCFLFVSIANSQAAEATRPLLEIERECREMVPIYPAVDANETFITSLLCRQPDDLFFGASSGKKEINLFTYSARSGEFKVLDRFEALWWGEPVLAQGPDSSVFMGAKCIWDKQFTFERNREREADLTADYLRRLPELGEDEVNKNATGMPIRQYSAEGRFMREFALPETLLKDGAGALHYSERAGKLFGISSPGGHLFVIDIPSGAARDLGEVTPFPQQHHIRRISKAFMEGPDGTLYFSGTLTEKMGEEGDDEVMGFILAVDPNNEQIRTTAARLPAVIGRRRLAGIDAAVRLADGSTIGGTTDGYLFRFDPKSETLETFGKPLRQSHIVGLVLGREGLVYGAGGEPGGLPRLFAFDPVTRQMYLGFPTSGPLPEGNRSSFSEIGAAAITSDGVLVCGEHERRGNLMVYRPCLTQSKWVKTYTAGDFQDNTRDRFVELTDESRGLRLAPTYLISDAMFRNAKIQEQLSDQVYAKKIFYLPSDCREIEVLFYGGGGTEALPMTVVVNDHRLKHFQDREAMLTGGWDRMTIPGEYLCAGKNEIAFGVTGWLAVDSDVCHGNSLKSVRSATSWRDDILGPDNNLTGEYAVRIRVHGYPEQGITTSPILDLAQIAAEIEDAEKAKTGIAPLLDLKTLRLRTESYKPPLTSIEFEIRAGSTADGQPIDWTPWLPLAAIEALPKERFFQWRAILRSSDVKATPWLKKVTLDFGGELTGTNQGKLKLTVPPDNEVTFSSYPFRYADPHHPRMRHLREKYNLEAVVAPGKTELEKFALLRQWVREQWEGWDDGKYVYCPQWDALEVLELAPSYLGLGMCTHYAAVFVQCAASLGYNARSVILDHHCIAEAWSNEEEKWIAQDVGLISNVTTAMQFNLRDTDEPLSVLEIHERFLKNDASDMVVIGEPKMTSEEFWNRYLDLYTRFGIPFRNDHLYNPMPQELEHGNQQYHWDGYLWWTDDLNPKYPEYSNLTNRPEDFYWTLNKTLVDIRDTGLEGVAAVTFHGNIPNFDRFEVRLNGGEWKKSDRTMDWKLVPGTNKLEVKAINTMGIEGIVNRVELEYRP